MRYYDLITESAVKWKWRLFDKDAASALFKIDNVVYEFKAINMQYQHEEHDIATGDYDDSAYADDDYYDDPVGPDYSGYWWIEFDALSINGRRLNDKEAVSLTGTGNAATVISTVTEILGDFIKRKKNTIQTIEYDHQNLRSRIAVYNHMFKRLTPDWTKRRGSISPIEMVNPKYRSRRR